MRRILIPISILTRELVDELHSGGYRVGASLLDGPADVRRVLELDVETSASNLPAYARELLEAEQEFTTRFPGFTRQPLPNRRG